MVSMIKTFAKQSKIIREDDETNAAIDVMIQSMDVEDEPCVGIFWYNIKDGVLFGTHDVPVSECPYRYSQQWECNIKSDSKLHRSLWAKEKHKGNPQFQGDFTQIPRGRIFYFEDSGFVVFTGSWINNYPQVEELVIEEFNLPANVEFRQDEHWDIGHGWSEEF